MLDGGIFIQSLEFENRINLDKRSIPTEIIEYNAKLNEKFEIELLCSLNCDNHWIKIFNGDYLKICSLKRVNGPKTSSFLDKEIIIFKPIKTGKIRLLLVENSLLGPCKEIVYNINIIN